MDTIAALLGTCCSAFAMVLPYPLVKHGRDGKGTILASVSLRILPRDGTETPRVFASQSGEATVLQRLVMYEPAKLLPFLAPYWLQAAPRVP